MRYCVNCVSGGRPNLKFNNEGVCHPCLAYEDMKDVDWDARWNELEELADKYRGCNGDYYDCIVTASGGKDSYYQIYVMKELLGMNPLVVTVDNNIWTKTGRDNWNNMREEFGVDVLTSSINPKVGRKLIRKAFEKDLISGWYIERAIMTYPLQVAVRYNIPLVVYGENSSYLYGGPHTEDSPDATLLRTKDYMKILDLDNWTDDEITRKDLNQLEYPSDEELSGVRAIYLGYYSQWSPLNHAEWAKTRGFKDLEDTGEWIREGYIEQWDQIDAGGEYIMHGWLKFPKFGFQMATDDACILIREGRLTREEAVDLVIAEDWKLDEKILSDFLKFTGYTEDEFWEIVERFINHDVLEKRDGSWMLKPHVIKALREGKEVGD